MGTTIALTEPLTVRQLDTVRTLSTGEVIELTGERDSGWIKVYWKKSPEDIVIVWAKASDLFEYLSIERDS